MWWTVISTFFGGLFKNVWFQRGLIIAIAGALIWFGIHQIRADAAKDQLLKDQNVHLEQVIRDNKIMGQKLATIEQINGQILIKLDAANQKVVEKHDTVTHYIQSPDAQKSNRESSDILKNTIGMLRDD